MATTFEALVTRLDNTLDLVISQRATGKSWTGRIAELRATVDELEAFQKLEYRTSEGMRMLGWTKTNAATPSATAATKRTRTRKGTSHGA